VAATAKRYELGMVVVMMMSSTANRGEEEDGNRRCRKNRLLNVSCNN